TYDGAFGRRHGSPHIGVPGIAMARRELRGRDDPCASCGQVGLPKSKASKGPVPLHPLLAEFMLRWKQKTPYSRLGDWVFPSDRLKGEQPRVANMLVEDYLRPAAVKAGILSSHRDEHGRLV